jgi:hypothetical protein
MAEQPSDRVRAALVDDLPMRDLTAAEAVEMNVLLNARIADAVATTTWDIAAGPLPGSHVAVDDAGRLVEYHPDGATTFVE